MDVKKGETINVPTDRVMAIMLYVPSGLPCWKRFHYIFWENWGGVLREHQERSKRVKLSVGGGCLMESNHNRCRRKGVDSAVM